MIVNRRQSTLRLLIGLFFGMLLLLTFLSNTIQSLSLPKVSVEQPSLGALELTVEGSGFLQPAQTAQLYPQGDWKVDSILKREGEPANKGDPLIVFDTESTRRQLEDERTRYEQKEAQVEKLLSQMKTALRNEDMTGIDNQRRDLEVIELDMEIMRRSIADLEKIIAEGGTLTAPFDGVVTKLRAAEGAPVGRGQPVIELADSASGYSFSFSVNENDGSLLQIGQTVAAWIEETERRKIDGQISGIADNPEDDSLNITIDVGGEGLKPGMKASVSISHVSGSRGTQIPISTLRSDNSGDYVLTVKEEDGPLGTAYYVAAIYVTVQEESEDTAVVDGLSPNDQVIVEASEPIDDGDRVRY